MTASALLSLLLVWLAAIVSPGPDVIQVIRLGTRSRAAGMWAAVGVSTGILVWMSASPLGLSAVVSARPGVLAALQLAGGAYLLWMGVAAVRSGAAAPTPTTPAAHPDNDRLNSWQAWRIGAATNLANPKALIFFGAVFAQFIRPDMGAGWTLTILVVLMVTALAWFLLLAQTVRGMARLLVANARIVDTVSGLMLIGLALWMLVDGVRSLAG